MTRNFPAGHKFPTALYFGGPEVGISQPQQVSYNQTYAQAAYQPPAPLYQPAYQQPPPPTYHQPQQPTYQQPIQYAPPAPQPNYYNASNPEPLRKSSNHEDKPVHRDPKCDVCGFRNHATRDCIACKVCKKPGRKCLCKNDKVEKNISPQKKRTRETSPRK